MCKIVLFLAASFGLSTLAPVRLSAQNRLTVPFVGCKSDGQMGPVAAPHGHYASVAVPANLVTKLAWYKDQYGPGALAPRGWHCFAVYGSNGSSLFITPKPIDQKLLFSSEWKDLLCPAIQVTVAEGDTSGRFEVARAIARLFPAYTQFLRNVIEERIEPASSFPSGPYPGDKIHRIAKNVVEFETPANQEGLGTASRLRSGPESIEGVAILVGEQPSLIQIFIRQSPQDRNQDQVIIKQFEQDVTREEH